MTAKVSFMLGGKPAEAVLNARGEWECSEPGLSAMLNYRFGKCREGLSRERMLSRFLQAVCGGVTVYGPLACQS